VFPSFLSDQEGEKKEGLFLWLMIEENRVALINHLRGVWKEKKSELY
jgi:hypothetical protein